MASSALSKCVQVAPGNVGLGVHGTEAQPGFREHPGTEEGDIVVVRVEHAAHGAAAQTDGVGDIGRVDVPESGHRESFPCGFRRSASGACPTNGTPAFISPLIKSLCRRIRTEGIPALRITRDLPVFRHQGPASPDGLFPCLRDPQLRMTVSKGCAASNICHRGRGCPRSRQLPTQTGPVSVSLPDNNERTYLIYPIAMPPGNTLAQAAPTAGFDLTFVVFVC